MKTKEKDNMDASLTIRLSQKEKKEIKNTAKNAGKDISEYCRMKLKKREKYQDIICYHSHILVLHLELIEYIRQNYDCEDDEYLRKKVEELWEFYA